MFGAFVGGMYLRSNSKGDRRAKEREWGRSFFPRAKWQLIIVVLLGQLTHTFHDNIFQRKGQFNDQARIIVKE